ncbi:restriction endonuclease subunit S [Segatella bryantii]|uniref:restriction endonuclease subunit S n=1 Tax=Segatella bryantii TaxID=77095 RepID=UPI001EDB92FD|nr:restriction endonuclease subunit S [Segatella bryantii]UKK72974.1 restriction endonuclease subunit S [Segatella bryantii]
MKRRKSKAMGLKKYKLGELIELTDERNSSGRYSLEDVKGISTEKNFIETKANMDGVSLDSYKVVNFRDFAYVPDTSRRGDKIALAFNNNSRSVLVSSIYTTFKCNRLDLLIPEFLYMYFNRPEFDRYARFNSWGSARETFSWEDFCDIDITLPSIEQQRKYVDVYLALQNNLAAYQSKVEELKLVCDGYIDQLKVKIPKQKVGNLLETVDKRNSELAYTDVQGININKKFFPTVANIDESNTRNYKVVENNQFAFSGMQTGRDMCIRIALNEESKPVIISPAYTVFRIKDDKDVLSHYIMLWFSRKQIDRYGWFASDGSIRSNLDLERFCEMEIPIPNISVQREIVNIHKCYIERQRIAEALKEQLKNICPVLIRGSLTE